MILNNTIAVIGDVHGCYNTLKELYSKLTEIEEIYCVGDLVDRGKYSKETVEFCIQNSIKPVKGNHEDMLIKSIDSSDKFLGFMSKDAEHYYYNGGRETQYSYIGSRLFSNFKSFKNEIKSNGHYRYLKNLPFKYDLQKIVVSHAGIIEGGDNVSILWNRDSPAHLDQLQIFGHTPLEELKYIKNYYANIDTGCVYKNKLTAVIVDTLEGKIDDVIQVSCDPLDVDIPL